MARILIAEDDAYMLRIISMWLQRNGHEVCEASNGLLAQEQLLSRVFDFVVSDVNMPGMDGISLVRWVRLEHKSDVPMVLLSSRCDQMLISQELDPFGVEVHPKPFSPSRLVAAIEQRLAEHARGNMERSLTPQGDVEDRMRGEGVEWNRAGEQECAMEAE